MRPDFQKRRMDKSDRIKLLNALLAGSVSREMRLSAEASAGIDAALSELARSSRPADLREFAKSMLSIYDPGAEAEVMEFDERHFDPLFAIPELVSAMRRLSGFPRSVLIVYGLDSSLRGASGRGVRRRRAEYSRNVAFIEDYAMRYADLLPNLKILFV